MPCEIVVVEDNDADFLMLREAILAASFTPRLTQVNSGVRTAEHLRELLALSPGPGVLILDYHLPVYTAPELLKTLLDENARALDGVRTIVMSGPLPAESAVELGELGVSEVIEKPYGYDDYMEIGRRLRDWCQAEAG
jgi:DNA-binding NtrC family response regulator